MDHLVPSTSTPTSSSSSLPGGSSSSSGSISSSAPPNQQQQPTAATTDTPAMVQCPACAQLVPLTLINQHLDQNCQSFSGTSPPDSYDSPPAPTQHGSTGNGKGKSKQTTPTSSYYRQPSLHTFFGGVDPTIPNDFILTRNAAKGGTLQATFSRHGMQTLARVEWSASVYLRGLKKSIVLATDIKLDELADELGQLSIQPLFDGEEEFDDSEFGDEDEDGEDGVVWVEEHGEEDAGEDAMDIDHGTPVASAAAASSSSSSSATTQPPAPSHSAPKAAPTPLPPPSQQQQQHTASPNKSETTIRYVPYLKSHLQKCIRRRLVDQSVSTALALINVNYNEFIRRIPIIAVEDARVFGAAFPVLVWLMLAASKGYTPLPQALIPDVLGAVAQIAASNVQDKGWMHCPRGERGNEVNAVLNSIEVAEGLPRWARDILWSIRCRREFGGMAGDIKMLDQSLICLFHRFATCPDRSVLESQFLAPVPILPTQAIPGPIQPNRFLLNAIDFHVSPILAHLATRFPQFSEDLLKATVWECSSGVNRRSAATNWDPVKAKAGDPSQGWEWDTPREYAPSAELVHVWRAIEGEFMKMAMELLVKRGGVA